MKLRKLLILMWKHSMVRLRRFIHTPIEILSPIVFILILFFFKDKINPVRRGTQLNAHTIKNTDEVTYSQLPNVSRLLYTPNTKYANDLMDAVGIQLHLKRCNSSVLRAATKCYCGFNNVTDVNGWIEGLNNNDAIVLFDGLEEEVWPVHLSYTVRMKGAFFTSEISARDAAGPAETHKNYGIYYHRFMRLQWAIDTSFIEVLTGIDITQAMSVQEFPVVARTNDQQMTLISEILQSICWLSLFLVFVFLMARLLEERCTGIQELVKMVGVSSNLFGISHFLNALPAGLVYSVVGTVLLKATSSPLIPHSNGFLIFIMLALHFVSVVAMAFSCSYISQNTQYTVTLSVFAYIILWVPARALAARNVGGLTLASGLLPHVPMQWLWKEVAAREQYGEALSFSDAFSSHSGPSGPVALGALCLVLQALLMFALAWYLARVRPGQYGQALPWNFFLQKQYWSRNEIKPEMDSDEEVPITRESKFFEEPPNDMETGIKVENVTKVYPKHTALNNVSLDVYKGEITVLLGHNGAGKTTLMSIITGMTSATEGRVLVNGVDTTKANDEVRMQMGLCPQHNLFFPDLTVLEHAMFFTLLKGGTFKNASKKSYELLEKLGIREKAGVYSSALSGGMKRRLQLACALAGGASVLVLDEPTSGLDVETRRELWDLLLSLRGERTVLLTTHFMEEADALGDRVAALHAGRLRCFATTMHLKKAIGTGYRLTFTTNGAPREAAVTAAVTSRVHDATLKEKTINSLSYNLPAAHSGDFPALFSTLEERKSDLGIETIGVGVSTLEEVFLKLCSDTDTTFAENQDSQLYTKPTYNKVTGPVLYWRQFMVLLKRQFRYAWYRKVSFFFLQILMPIIMICVFTVMTNESHEAPRGADVMLDMGLYAGLAERRVLCDVTPAVRLRALSDAWPKVNFKEESNVTGAVLRASENDATDYQKYIAGIEIDDSHAKALFTTTVRHAAPISVNLLTNALATRYIDNADGRTFQTRLDPLSSYGAISSDVEIPEAKNIGLLIMYCVLIVFVVFSTNINSVSLPCKERLSGARHIHLMSGCPASLYWAATLAFHACACAVFLVAAVAVAAAALDADNTINAPSVVLSMAVVLIVGSFAFFAFSYLVSFYCPERVASTVLVAILIVFGIITTTIKTGSDFFKDSDSETTFTDVLLSMCSYTMPPHGATVAFAKVVYNARLNAICENNRDKCPNLFIPEPGLNVEKCCVGERPHCYLCMDKNAPGPELIVLAVQFCVYMTLVILAQLGVFNYVYDRIFNGKYRHSSHKTDIPPDEIVRAEAMYVEKQIALPKMKIKESEQAMLVNNLHKNYFRCRKSCNAVRGISFSVKKGECFGLLGVNGAGKSTTFKMLTAEECPTMGNIYGNGFFRSERQPYLHSLGYCPQFFGLDDFLTGRENLELLLTLRGLDAKDVSEEAKSWIDVVGLEKYSDRKVVGYSGGCTRRLAAAAALSSGAPLTLLDEPTAGVDVSARRRVWSALQRGLAQGRAVIITSHSMDEMEALCARIAIMSAGVIRAVGTPSELRAHHAAGHAVLIKVARVTHADGDEVDSTKSELAGLKGTLQSKFNCTLKDEHKTMLHYHINETMRYSNIFTALEELKAKYPSLVEDYSVTETTLEEVFLSFAKEQRQKPESEGRNHVV